MEFSITSEQKAFRDAIIKFARQELNQDVGQRDRDHEFRRDLWQKCGAMGLLGLPVDEQYGGSGLDAVSTVIALQALGYGCHDSGLNFSVCAHLLACVIPLWKHGSDAQKEAYLPKLCNGDWIAVNAMTEPGTGSDPFAMKTQARKDGDDWVLSGVKTFSTNGPVADLAVVYAMTDPEKGFNGGITAFLVEREKHGFGTGQTFEKMGLRTSPIGEIVFDEVRVPESAIIGRVGGGAVMFSESMDWERSCLVACHVGVMERLLESAVDYARNRKQFGQSIGKFQAVSHRLADIKVSLEASRLLVCHAAWALEHTRTAGQDAAITKLFVSESLVQSAMDAMRTLGGYGYMVEYDMERVVRDAMGSVIYSGTSDMQKNIIARWLGL